MYQTKLEFRSQEKEVRRQGLGNPAKFYLLDSNFYLLYSVFLMFSFVSWAFMIHLVTATPPPPSPAVYFPTEPTVDGRLSESDWFTLGATANALPNAIWIGYDRQGLYLAALLETGKLSGKPAPKDLWNAERIELQIHLPEKPGYQLRAAAHPAASTQTFWEASRPGGSSTPIPLKGVKMPGAYSEGRCTIEAFVPWTALGLSLPPLTVQVTLGHVNAGQILTTPTREFSFPPLATLSFTLPPSQDLHHAIREVEQTPLDAPDRAQLLHRISARRDPASVPALLETFDIPATDLHQASERALLHLPEEIILENIRRWNISPTRTLKGRIRVASLLHQLKSPQRYDVLLDLLSQESDAVLRVAAAKNLTTSEAVPFLLNTAEHDPHPAKRRAALGLIGAARLTDPKVFPALEQILSHDDEWGVRVETVWAAHKLESPQFLPALERALRSDPEPAVRAAIAKALGSMNDGRAVISLTIVLQQDQSPLVREEAALSLGRLNDPQSIPALENALKDSHPDVAQAALEALRKLKPTRK